MQIYAPTSLADLGSHNCNWNIVECDVKQQIKPNQTDINRLNSSIKCWLKLRKFNMFIYGLLPPLRKIKCVSVSSSTMLAMTHGYQTW